MRSLTLFALVILVLFGLLFLETSGSTFAQQSDSPDTLLIGIISFDTVLHENGGDIITKAQIGSANQSNLTTVFLYDVYHEPMSIQYDITNGEVVSTEIDKVDVGSPAELADFIQSVRAEHNAEREMLTLVGHGFLPSPEISWEVDSAVTIGQSTGGVFEYGAGEYPETPFYYPISPFYYPISPFYYPISSEEIAVVEYDSLSTPEMGDMLSLATDGGENPFDILLFDQCFQGSLGSLYEVGDSAEVFIASSNYAWAVYPYDDFLPTLATGSDNETIADNILTDYQNALNEEHPNNIFWITSEDVNNLANWVGELGGMLTQYIENGLISRSDVADLLPMLQYVDSNLNSEMSQPDEYVTVHSLATAVQTLHPNFERQTNDILYVIEERMGSQSISGSPHFNRDTTWTFDTNDSITVVAPLDPSTDPSLIWHSYIYANSETELSVSYEDESGEEVHLGTGTVTRPLQLAQDGFWDDFIDYWYPDQSIVEIAPWIPAPVHTVSESLFEFEDNTNWGYHYFNVGSTAIVDDAMELTYTGLMPYEYVAFDTRSIPIRNWNYYHALSIDIQGTNSGNDITVYAYDRTTGQYTYTIKDDFVGWQTFVTPLHNGGLQNSTASQHDFSDMFSVGLEVRAMNAQASDGSVRIDNLRLLAGADSVTLFDFDNNASRWGYHYTSVSKTTSQNGIFTLEYENLPAYKYTAHASGGLPIYQWHDYETLSFYVKGTNSGNQIKLYLNSDTVGWSDYDIVDDSSEWREIIISLDQFSSSQRPTDVYRVGFQVMNMSPITSTGSLQIDKIMLNR